MATGVLGLLLAAAGGLRGQEVAPPEVASPEVIGSALEAVTKLGKQVVLGNHQYAIDRMYPRWKQRMAKRMGGMEELERRLKEGIEERKKQMVANGISLIGFWPEGKPRVFEVWPGKKTVKVDGQPREILVKTSWMILIPTAKKFRFIDELGKYRYIERREFQIAISSKAKIDWYFLGGGDLTVADLRSLFPGLPENLQLPEISDREVER